MSMPGDLKDIRLAELGSAPRAVRWGVAALLMLAIAAVGYGVKLKAQRAHLAALKTTGLALSAQLAQAREKVAGVENARAQVAQTQASLAVLARQLPSVVELPTLLDSISQRAALAGITTDRFEPGDESVHDFYAARPIRLRMLGQYHQFGRFAAQLAALPQRAVLRDISLQPSPGRDGVLQLGGVIFLFRDLDEQPAAGLSPGETVPAVALETVAYPAAELPDPFRAQIGGETRAASTSPPPDSQRRREALEQFPLDALAMAGTLTVGATVWALIKDPDGKVHRVTQGHYLGPDHGRVVRVGEDRVEILEQVPDEAGGSRRRTRVIARAPEE